MTTSLDQLKQTGTTVVSDSGDFESKLVIVLVPSLSPPNADRVSAIDVYKPQVRTCYGRY